MTAKATITALYDPPPQEEEAAYTLGEMPYNFEAEQGLLGMLLNDNQLFDDIADFVHLF